MRRDLAGYYKIIKKLVYLKVCVIVDACARVCTSLVSRLFLIERGNEPGDEAMFAPAVVLPAKDR